MILSFASETAADIYHGRDTRAARRIPKNLWKIAVRKFDLLDSAHSLIDLKVPPGNRLEPLQGRYQGKYSIRINKQFRIIFCFEASHAYEVDVLDYH